LRQYYFFDAFKTVMQFVWHLKAVQPVEIPAALIRIGFLVATKGDLT